MRRLQVQPNHVHQKKIVNSILIAVFTVFCLITFLLSFAYIMLGYTETLAIVFTNSYSYVLFLMFMYTIQFVFAALLLSSRFNLLNEYLRYVPRL